MINAQEFTDRLNSLIYPSKDDCTKYHVYRKSIVYLKNATIEKFNEWVYDEFDVSSNMSITKIIALVEREGYIVEKDVDQKLYNQLSSDYTLLQCKIESDFRNYLYTKFDVEDNPKNLQCFNLAWTYGHSSGFSEVETYFHDLVELIK